MLAKFIAHVLLLLASVILGIAILINGYGLEIHSWGWIVGGCIVQMLLMALNVILAKGE